MFLTSFPAELLSIHPSFVRGLRSFAVLGPPQEGAGQEDRWYRMHAS